MSEIKELLEAHGIPPKEIYLDWENGSRIDDEIFEAMRPFFLEKAYGNPAITHRIGWESYEYYVKFKDSLARTLSITSRELAITHSATESNNLAIKGVTKSSERKKIVISPVEHLSIVKSAEALKKAGYKIEYIPVDERGIIKLDELQNIIDTNTLLVSVQTGNHEIGSIQPIKEVVEIVKDTDENIIVHSDLTVAYGRMTLDLHNLGIDMATFDSRHINGPKGIAALYIKEGLKIQSIYHGQLSIETLSPDVENLPLLAGFAKASEIIFRDFDNLINRLRKLRNKLMYGLTETINKTLINGPEGDQRLPDNVNISFLDCEGEALTVECSMHGIYASSGSACSSRILTPSHILTAIGRKPEEAHGSLLMKVSRLNTEEEIDYVLDEMPKIVERIRKIKGDIKF